MISYLTIPNQYGKTAKVLLTENFPNLEIVQVPELSTTSGEMPRVFATVSRTPEMYCVES